MPSRAKVYSAIVILAVAAAIGGLALYYGSSRQFAVLPEPPTVGGPFSLTDHNGRAVTDADFRGKYMLVFFGYTYCPDVCPTELQVMTYAVDSMGSKGERINPIFISIDPERDTPEILRAYVENFSPRLLGLTGSPEQIAAVAKAYRAYYKKSGNTDTSDYLMDHSSIIYLMGPDGLFLKHFTYTTDAKALAKSLASIVMDPPKD